MDTSGLERILLETSGGFAGMPPRQTELTLPALDPVERQRIVRAVERVQPSTAPPAPAPDALSYRLTFDAGGDTRVIVTDDASASNETLALIELILDFHRRQQG
jgi:hypothetical protein